MHKEGNGPWIYEELDGTPHYHDEDTAKHPQTAPTMVTTTTPSLNPQPEQPPQEHTWTEEYASNKQGADIRQQLLSTDERLQARDKKIEASFDEKMEKYDELTKKIDKLSTSTDLSTAATAGLAAVLQSIVDVLKQWVDVERRKVE